MSFLAVGGTLLAGSTIGAGTIAAGAGLLGTGLNLIGQNQQEKAISGANATNRAAVDKANNQEWNNYLLQRGVNAGGAAPYGVIPTNAAPVNARLPLWANMNMPTAPSGGQPNVPLFVKRGP